MDKKITNESAIDEGIAALEAKLAIGQDVQQAIDRLQTMKSFDRNLATLGRTIIEIRNDAEKCRRLAKHGLAASTELSFLIEKIIRNSDSLHNVPKFMTVGILCDAQYLYFHGVDDNWPTGLPGGALQWS